MKRRKFLAIAGGVTAVAGAVAYLASDKKNFERKHQLPGNSGKTLLQQDEARILYLASLAPSGHNTQPWLVKYVEPFHWIIGNDKSKWLPAVDPLQRETVLSIGAFMQNLEYAANSMGYACAFHLLAGSNQDENIIEVKLSKASKPAPFDAQKIVNRRTVRSNFLSQEIAKPDLENLTSDCGDHIHFLSPDSKQYSWINEQTIEANRIQTYRNEAQNELADWMRFSSKEASANGDGLTTASMEIQGLAAWFLRNFYGKKDVLKTSFREKGLDKVREQVAASGGWLLISSKDNSTATLVETGMMLQRILLRSREKMIAIHPMTQILEEKETYDRLRTSLGLSDPVQFILRMGYLKTYPAPVSLRRPVTQFVKQI